MSVALDAVRQVLYVSNIDGKEPWGRDGAGSIARVNLDGTVRDVEWITGLDAPKGPRCTETNSSSRISTT